MTPTELRSSIALASVSGLRLFGMFVILPVFALFAEGLPGGDDQRLVGLALGIYGLTQAVLQVPFGWVSDRWGRKPTLYTGLLIFALGSFIAALSTTIYGVIAGRVVQGAGAVSAAAIALTADLTREEVRTKAMAIIGITIGVTFALSMGVGPVLDRLVGVPGIFAMTGVLALGSVVMVRFAVPTPPAVSATADRPKIRDVMGDRELLRLNVGIFVLHAALMALFVVIPLMLRSAGLASQDQWKLYLPVMSAAFLLIIPVIAVAERYHRLKLAFVGAIVLMAAGVGLLAVASDSLMAIGVGLLIFFKAFNFLEASLPSLTSRLAPARAKGTAAGVFASVQYLGTFVGGVAGGLISHHYGSGAVFFTCAGVVVVWFFVALGMTVPVLRVYPVPIMDEARAVGLGQRLRALPGVREVLQVSPGGTAQLKVDMARFDEDNALRLIQKEI
jgi:MFS family permease